MHRPHPQINPGRRGHRPVAAAGYSLAGRVLRVIPKTVLAQPGPGLTIRTAAAVRGLMPMGAMREGEANCAVFSVDAVLCPPTVTASWPMTKPSRVPVPKSEKPRLLSEALMLLCTLLARPFVRPRIMLSRWSVKRLKSMAFPDPQKYRFMTDLTGQRGQR
jgi:hypothetical protein